MARLIPELTEDQLRALQSAAEAKFYRACRNQLDESFLVVHSLSWVRVTPGGFPSEGEADFLIVSPQHGFVCVEVKGGGVRFDPSRSRWTSIDRYGNEHEIKDPFAQARREKHSVLGIIKDELKGQKTAPRWILGGHAVFFPDIDDTRALRHPDAPQPIVGGRTNLVRLNDWLEDVFSFWKGQEPAGGPLGEAAVRLIESAFSRVIRLRPLLSAVIEEEEGVHIELTEQQSRIFRALGSRRRAAISGGAGTGKTMLAIEKAAKAAREGRDALLLCYNKPLGDYLAKAATGIDRLHAASFHHLCGHFANAARKATGADVMREAEIEYPGADRYAIQLPFCLALATEHVKHRYDTIVVDEGQDFGEEYWMPVEMLLRDSTDNELFVFFDRNQRLYSVARTFPIRDEPFHLTVNCRNTRHIHDSAYRFYKGIHVDPPPLVGAPLETIAAPTINSQGKRIRALVTRLLVDEKLPPHSICVLIAGQPKRIYYDALLKLGLPRGATWAMEDPGVQDTVLVDTVRRYKGLESAYVVLWGVDSSTDPEVLYVGMSRAKSRLVLVGEKPQGLLTAAAG